MLIQRPIWEFNNPSMSSVQEWQVKVQIQLPNVTISHKPKSLNH